MCTVEKRGDIFILTLTSNEENDQHLINPTTIASFQSALFDVKSEALASPDSSFALITTATGKYFSNGFDLQWVLDSQPSLDLSQIVDSAKPLLSDLLSLPMPTIAAINGHAAAAGFALALCHDYLLMPKDRGVLYMSEVDNGFSLPKYLNVLFTEKFGWKSRREMVLRGRKLKGEQGLELGVVDQVFENGDQVLEGALSLGQQLVDKKWNGKVYAEIRKGLCPNFCEELGLSTSNTMISKM